jgi:hypothetical protein
MLEARFLVFFTVAFALSALPSLLYSTPCFSLHHHPSFSAISFAKTQCKQKHPFLAREGTCCTA